MAHVCNFKFHIALPKAPHYKTSSAATSVAFSATRQAEQTDSMQQMRCKKKVKTCCKRGWSRGKKPEKHRNDIGNNLEFIEWAQDSWSRIALKSPNNPPSKRVFVYIFVTYLWSIKLMSHCVFLQPCRLGRFNSQLFSSSFESPKHRNWRCMAIKGSDKVTHCLSKRKSGGIVACPRYPTVSI